MQFYQAQSVSNPGERSKRQRFPSKFSESISALKQGSSIDERPSKKTSKPPKSETSISYEMEELERIENRERKVLMKCRLPNGRQLDISVVTSKKKTLTKKPSLTEKSLPEAPKSLLDIFQNALVQVQQCQNNKKESHASSLILKKEQIVEPKQVEEKKESRREKQGDEEKFTKFHEKHLFLRTKLEEFNQNMVLL